MSTTTATPTSLRRSVTNTLKGSAGNLVEWYDVYAYSVFASYFESQLFAKDDPSAQVYVWAVFAVTFLMRPIGSWYFGRFADRHGRRLALTVSVTLMAACSFVIAIIPTAQVIGVGAVLILTVARLVQGFATGGEYGASATYLSEAAVPKHRGFLASFHYVTLVGGHVLAQLTLMIMVATMPAEAISAWGWRVAFAIGGLGAILVLVLRRTMDETMDAEAIAAAGSGAAPARGSMRELFANHWRPLLLCFFVTAGGPIAFYTYSVTGPAIVNKAFSGGDPMAGTIINLVALVFLMLLQPIGGWLSDLIGRRAILIFFGVGGVAYTWYLLTALPAQTDPVAAFALLAVGFVILTGFTSVAAAVKAELFPTHIRALGVGFGYALANSLFGGTAPLLYTAANAEGQVPVFIVYVSAVIFASLVAYVFFLPKKGRNWLDDEQGMLERRDRARAGEPAPVTASAAN